MLHKKLAAFVIVVTIFATGQTHARVVAIVDSGVLPIPELAPFLVPGGLDFVNGDADPTDDNGHGTLVGLLTVAASNNRARLLPIKSFNSAALALSSWVRQGISLAARNPDVRVINLSLASSVFDVAQLDTIKRAARRGKMVVIAAGNSGLPNPDFPGGTVGQFKGRGLAVGAIAPNNSMRPYSARAGNSAQYYVVAPDFLEEGLGGTSFAAPQVSGVAAAIFDHSPFLTANDVVDIIRRTAIDLGAPGVDAVYGHGRLNRAAALAPVGAARIPTGSSVAGGGGQLAAQALTLGAPFAYAILDSNPHLESTLILDEFNRAFHLDLGSAVNVPDPVTRLSSLMRSLRHDTSAVQTDFGNLHFRAWLSEDPPLRSTYASDVFGQDDYADRGRFVSMMFEGNSHAGWGYGFGYNVDPRNVFGMMDGGGLEAPPLLTAGGFDAPYLGFGDRSNTMHFGYRFSDRAQVRIGWTTLQNHARLEHDSRTATAQALYQMTDALSFSASLSNAHERGGLLGGSSEGVFSIDDARTVVLGAGVTYRINSKLALTGQYTYGYTRVDGGTSSLLSNFSALHGEAYGFGLIGNSVFRRDDRLGVMIAQPLRITHGEVDIDVPFARDFAGNVYTRSQRASLVPGGQETDFEVAYTLPLPGAVELSGHFLWQREPLHSPNLDDRLTVAVAVRARF